MEKVISSVNHRNVTEISEISEIQYGYLQSGYVKK